MKNIQSRENVITELEIFARLVACGIESPTGDQVEGKKLKALARKLFDARSTDYKEEITAGVEVDEHQRKTIISHILTESGQAARGDTSAEARLVDAYLMAAGWALVTPEAQPTPLTVIERANAKVKKDANIPAVV